MGKQTRLNEIFCIIVFKSFKNIKSPAFKKNLWTTQFFNTTKSLKTTPKSKRYVALIGRPSCPLNPPRGKLNQCTNPQITTIAQFLKAVD
jgi:hypothetical protein